VLIDIDLGEESGFALARSLGDGASRASVPHMILISTHDEGEYADLIEASPAVGFLAKTDLSAASFDPQSDSDERRSPALTPAPPA
jgi:hypothetical protein